MAVNRFTFPQSGDADDAEHFAAMIGQSNLTSYVETGMSFTYDSTVPEVDVSQGKGFIRLSQDTASSSGEDILEVNHVVQVPSQIVSLTDSALNYIYLEPNFGTDDNGDVSAYTSQQGGNVLLIGTIDTSTDEVTELNREPELNSRRLGLGDDQMLEFGDNDDFVWYYDSSEDRLALDNDSGTRLADVGDTLWEMEISLSLNDNSIDDVASIDGGGDRVAFDDRIDLTGQAIEYDLNAGVQELVDMPVDSSSAQGTQHSYEFDINGTDLLRVYAESDGAGSVQNPAVDALVDLDLNSNNIDNIASIDGGGVSITVNDDLDLTRNNLDSVNSIDGGGSAIQFGDVVDLNGNNLVDAGTTIWDTTGGHIEQTALENDDLTVTAGDGLKNGGLVALGGSTTLDVEPADFAGLFLADDGTDNLEVLIGRGLENDGSGAIQFDEDTAYTFTAGQTFNAGITVSGSVSLDADTLNATEVDIGRGLEDDGTGSIQFDEDTAYTFTVDQTFNANILDGAGNTVYDQANNEVPRERQDDNKITTTVSANTTTANEEVIYVDSSGGAVTLTLASADALLGNEIIVADVGGAASNNAITIDTEGTETINGSSSLTIGADYGTKVVSSDGTDWFTTGGGAGGGGVTVEEDDTTAVEGASALNFAHGTHASDDGDGTASVTLMNTRDPRM